MKVGAAGASGLRVRGGARVAGREPCAPGSWRNVPESRPAFRVLSRWNTGRITRTVPALGPQWRMSTSNGEWFCSRPEDSAMPGLNRSLAMSCADPSDRSATASGQAGGDPGIDAADPGAAGDPDGRLAQVDREHAALVWRGGGARPAVGAGGRARRPQLALAPARNGRGVWLTLRPAP